MEKVKSRNGIGPLSVGAVDWLGHKLEGLSQNEVREGKEKAEGIVKGA